ncbi:hypothetical protein ACRB68_67170 [Actinomadura sp. RB68]|uniref:Homing endonuclease LAGLIDADG domain-containing protein n=2 Tax=Actinomadura macrotermitis TaxID=2585200 RepID=A0A7K0C5C7_9ACTN|nr:hypothetical protein [Actinomadura macrotermitis]
MTVRPPVPPFSERDYTRGLVDADGSLGFTARGYPFIGFTTASSAMIEYFCEKVFEVTGRQRVVNRNKRDGVYNLMVTMEAALEMADWMYYKDCLALERKAARAVSISTWSRPPGMRARSARRRWTEAEDAAIWSMTIPDAAQSLGRTEKSIQMRRWMLQGTHGKQPGASR